MLHEEVFEFVFLFFFFAGASIVAVVCSLSETVAASAAATQRGCCVDEVIDRFRWVSARAEQTLRPSYFRRKKKKKKKKFQVGH